MKIQLLARRLGNVCCDNHGMPDISQLSFCFRVWTEKLFASSEEEGERFHEQVGMMEQRCEGKWNRWWARLLYAYAIGS
jgi:hypothetical protein